MPEMWRVLILPCLALSLLIPAGEERGTLAGQSAELDAVESHIASGRFPEAREELEQWWLVESGASRLDRQQALWLRARLTVDPAMAELDYRRLVVEYPGGEWSDAALLRLAQGAEFRGESGEARQYLEILVRDYPQSALRVEARDRMARMDAQPTRAGLPPAREESPPAPPRPPVPAPPGPPAPAPPGPPAPAPPPLPLPEATEPATERAALPPAPEAPAPRAESPSPEDDPPRAELPAPETPAPTEAPTPPAEGSFTVQIGAFSSEEGARAHANTLRSAGLEVRVVQVEGSPLFRVRMGAYATRTQAEAATRLPQELGFETLVGADREREFPPR